MIFMWTEVTKALLRKSTNKDATQNHCLFFQNDNDDAHFKRMDPYKGDSSCEPPPPLFD